jgi:signal transduction histidine kinase
MKTSLSLYFKETIIVLVILITGVSYGLFFYLQNIAEVDIRNSLFEEQKDRQLESTRALSEHIASDLDSVMTRLYGLANSVYLQKGDLISDQAEKFIRENYEKINDIVDNIYILDKEDVISLSVSPRGYESLANVDLSLRDWVKETRRTLSPVFFSSFERQGLYKTFITYPITNRESGDYVGLIEVSIPTVNFFSRYGNVHDINTQFLAVYNRNATLLAVGASKDLIGKNFFGEYTQRFINHNKVLNNLTRNLLAGKSGYGLYNYGLGDRLTTQYPVFVEGKPTYFIQVVTPATTIYSHVSEILLIERLKMFSLIAGTTAAVVVLVLLVLRWNRMLGNEVKRRTRELNSLNTQLERANEQLNEQGQYQKEFINVAAHELRNPIQPIIALTEVLRSKISDRSQSELIDIIIRNAKKLQRLAQDILDVSKIESKTFELSKEKCNLADIIAQVVQDYENTIKKSNLPPTRLITKTNGNLSLTIDRQKISQVISNLLGNAIKFTEGGTITVQTEKKTNEVIICVKDTGEGIQTKMFAKLFSKFSSGSSGGTGLGLYISKNIVEAHGGRIWAENNNTGEKGATFCFTLPV